MRLIALTALLSLPGAWLGAEDKKLPARPGPEYRIGPEDTLTVSVWQNAELTRTVPVRPDGKISLPLLNDIQAAGLTPMELRDQIKTRLADFAPATEVSVIVGEVQSFKVTVMGKVLKPDRYRLGSPTTVLDILGLAGGFQEYANEEKILILRPEPLAGQGRNATQTFKRMYFNYKRLVTTGGEGENFALQSGDIVVVP
jgi:polysaccharide biosynthesis/export protein